MTCPICCGNEGWTIPHREDARVAGWRAELGETERYFWTLCRECGSAYPSVAPNPAILDRLWASSRDLDANDLARKNEVWASRRRMGRIGAERALQILLPLCGDRRGRFLDIACGLGEAVALFRDRGWQAEGIDVDASTKRFHEALGIATRIGRFEDDVADGPFDLIHIAHAIYFITDPLGFLKRVRAQLAPDGLFVVVISDFLASTDNSLPGYAHTFYPCAASMRYALAAAGLATVLTQTRGGSIHLVARPAEISRPAVNTQLVHLRYASKGVRYAALGRPNLALRRLAKRVLQRS